MFPEEFCRWNSRACFTGRPREEILGKLCLPLHVFSHLCSNAPDIFKEVFFLGWKMRSEAKYIPLLSWVSLCFGSICCSKQLPIHVLSCAWISKETQSDLPTSMRSGDVYLFQQDGWPGWIRKWYYGLGSLCVTDESSHILRCHLVVCVNTPRVFSQQSPRFTEGPWDSLGVTWRVLHTCGLFNCEDWGASWRNPREESGGNTK